MPNHETARKNASKTVIVAMSGGVDSAACALLLKDRGFNVTGVTMDLLHGKAASEIEAAAIIACQLGFAHTSIELSREFDCAVIDPFCEAYELGLTPNPCVKCNKELKFGLLHELREREGADYLATGHYARIARNQSTGRWELLRATHPSKDQSYFLYNMTQAQLEHTLFPLGDLSKEETRALAQQAGLSVAGKSESQDICFIDGDYMQLLQERTGLSPKDGDIVDSKGKVLGRHRGLSRYTVGQRKGIGVAAPQPLYVLSKMPEENRLVVGTKDELLVGQAFAKEVNFVSMSIEEALCGPFDAQAKTTYRQDPVPGVASFDGDVLKVEFESPVKRVAPGQSIVLYDGERLLCGGTAVDNA